MSLTEQYEAVKHSLHENVKLVAVSKTHPASMIQEVYDLGQRVFGENKVQEMEAKAPHLPPDIQWHLIGHLQRNKVKYIAPFVAMIESVDSEKLLKQIDKEAAKNNRVIKVLLQVKIAAEDTKFGLTQEEARALFHEFLQGAFPHVEICGLMGMATNTDDAEQVRREFTQLKTLFEKLSKLKKLDTLSMGMSADYKLAMDCGSNSVRIGSAIFGARDYGKV